MNTHYLFLFLFIASLPYAASAQLAIAPVETAIPAFIGYTEKASSQKPDDLLLQPFRIASLGEYEKYFGGPQPEEKIIITVDETLDAQGKVTGSQVQASLPEADRSKHLMYYGLQLYFANGGGPCYIVSVGKYKPLGSPLIARELHRGLSAIRQQDEPTLLVIPEAQQLPIADCQTLFDAALQQCADLQDRFVIMDVHGGNISLADANADLLAAADNFRTSGVGNQQLKYGAAYAPNINTAIAFSAAEPTTQLIRVINGTATPPVMLSTLSTSDPNLYQRAQSAIRTLPCILPPSCAIAGIYAKTDASKGVWKAPANIGLSAVTQPSIPVSTAMQETLTVDVTSGKSINVIRLFSGKGTLVWGARTLAGNDNEWRYVPVRRFVNFVEESIQKGTESFVFEPNDANTWIKVQASIENFLSTLWRQGAMPGAKPTEAFYVSVGLGRTMTAQDIADGRLIIQLGLATVRPAEFTTIRITHQMAN